MTFPVSSVPSRQPAASPTTETTHCIGPQGGAPTEDCATPIPPTASKKPPCGQASRKARPPPPSRAGCVMDERPPKDHDEWLRWAGEKHARHEAEKTKAKANGNDPNPSSPALPVITVEGGKRHEAADQGLAALVCADVAFYQRDRKIQRVALVKAKNTSGDI